MSALDIWQVIKPHFNRSEKWGDPDRVDPITLTVLYLVRKEVGVPIIIKLAYEESGHTENSYHYVGKAIDFHINNLPFLVAVDSVERALRRLKLFNFVGLGIYPDWNSPGFHLDTRGHFARWSAQYHKKDGHLIQEYYGYDVGVEYAREKFGG